jgi:hypothetical protein
MRNAKVTSRANLIDGKVKDTLGLTALIERNRRRRRRRSNRIERLTIQLNPFASLRGDSLTQPLLVDHLKRGEFVL